ncbi:MAG: ferredoxin--NADP reductase [Candidatus Marinimicrobia bacterium]|nr:ferredoxin--NADP reductase [Candidatus Neomarinimicrobiota bacterium]
MILLLPHMAATHKTLIYNATVVSREDLSPTLAIFRIAPDVEHESGTAVPEFIAGQYAVLGLNNIAQPEKGYVRRAYSIASPPNEKRWLEFYVRYVNRPTSANPLTHLMWGLQQGDGIWVGPKVMGKFTLADTIGEGDPRFKLFVAAGTGLAPFISILKQLADPEHHVSGATKEVALLHGASHPHDMAYREDIEALFEGMKRRYFPTVSRPQEHPDWKGDTGRVETFFDDEKLETLEQRLGKGPGFLTPENSVIYICGLQGTIGQTLIRMFRRGFVPNDRKIRAALALPDHLAPSIFFEQYDTLPILELDNSDFVQSLKETFPGGL